MTTKTHAQYAHAQLTKLTDDEILEAWHGSAEAAADLLWLTSGAPGAQTTQTRHAVLREVHARLDNWNVYPHVIRGVRRHLPYLPA